MGTPAVEFEIHEALVGELLAEQHPDLAVLHLEHMASGWDNEMFRVGPDLVVRLPRREAAAHLVINEQRWLPALGELPLPVPTPLRVGRPGCGYPWNWSIVPWAPGAPAWRSKFDDEAAAAACLGGFVAALHRPAPPDAPTNPYRGVPLAQRDQRVTDALDRLDASSQGWAEAIDLTRGAVEERWRSLVATRPWAGPALWLHGDLHPLNVLVDEGRISAVIDFGDITSGDPATDLGVAWMHFSDGGRAAYRDAASTGPGGIDVDTWRRAQGWALSLGLAFMNGDDAVRGIGYTTLRRVMADSEPV